MAINLFEAITKEDISDNYDSILFPFFIRFQNYYSYPQIQVFTKEWMWNHPIEAMYQPEFMVDHLKAVSDGTAIIEKLYAIQFLRKWLD